MDEHWKFFSPCVFTTDLTSLKFTKNGCLGSSLDQRRFGRSYRMSYRHGLNYTSAKYKFAGFGSVTRTSVRKSSLEKGSRNT